jgi:hypothetical protein
MCGQVWATGGDAFNLPENVGMPIAEDEETTYFLFEIHYDNPELMGGLYDSSGLRLLYTRKVRQYDADTATMGSVADYRLFIPPQQESVTIAGHCHPSCFRNKIPPSGLHVIASLPHGHKHGIRLNCSNLSNDRLLINLQFLVRRILVRHFRNGTELEPIAEENNYDFNFQDFQRSPDQCRILQEDHIVVECTYNTRNRDTPLFVCIVHCFYSMSSILIIIFLH